MKMELTTRIQALETVLDRYEIIEEKQLAELDSAGLLLRHKKSGARVLLLLNEDDNKVFSIGFRTPPEDSTGVAHILEHSVLCGSDRFPAKDSFVELIKGSLNTFLNAMTYPDKTVYPVASCNQADFKNLMHVYLDAVFAPAIYRQEEIFRQEGWHYEVAEDGSLTYNGVVFNEMKGALSSPDDLIFDRINEALFPDVTYSQESGGDPEVIPQLTYEQFLDFHRKYYHPTNSYIYLYGDMDAAERLDWMDREYLSRFEEDLDARAGSQIPLQQPVDVKITTTYGCGEGEEEESGEWLAYNVVTGLAADTLLSNAMQILEYVLVEVPGAPIKKALLDAGLGRDVRGILNTDVQQPTLSFLVKNAPAGSTEQFIEVLQGALRQQAEEGMNKKSLLAAINFFEFRYREADYGYYPKGLIYGLNMLSSWLYEEKNPFSQLEQAEVFAKLRQLAEEGYFENLIREQILGNPHRAVVTMKPEAGRSERLEEAERVRLAEARAAMGEEEQEKVRQAEEALRAYQDRPSTKEELETIPLLQLSDIEKKAPALIYEERELAGRPLVFHDIATNGIVYLRMLFDTTDMPEEDIPYLTLLSTCLGYVDSENYTYGEFANDMLLCTGGITTNTLLYTKQNRADEYKTYMEIKARYLEPQTEKAMELTEEMLFRTEFRDETRMKEILAETVSRMQQRMADNGNSTAVTRGLSYVSASGQYKELGRGIAYYRFLKGLLDDFENRKEEIFSHLNGLCHRIFTRERVVFSVTAEESGRKLAEERLAKFMDLLPENEETVGQAPVLEPECRNEAFKCAGQVQYVTRVGNFAKAGFAYTGALKVLTTILSYDYLWNHIRVKGGAYGCFSGFGLDGDSYLASYRDPNLAETEAVYNGVTEYMSHFTADEREMTKYILGTFSNLDTPLSPSARGARSFNAWLRGISWEELQQEREEVLATTQETIRELVPLVQAVLDADCRCTVGSESKIEKDKELFMNVERLL